MSVVGYVKSLFLGNIYALSVLFVHVQFGTDLQGLTTSSVIAEANKDSCVG